MVSPFVFVHPPEEHVKQVDQKLLVQRESLFVLLQLPYYLVADVNYVDGLVGLPVVLFVFPLYEKSNVVYETVEHSLLGLAALHDPQELTGHVLA